MFGKIPSLSRVIAKHLRRGQSRVELGIGDEERDLRYIS